MNLGIEFVLYGILIIVALLPLYIYREKLFFSKKTFNGDFDTFVKDLKIHMQKYHPNINIDYSIIQKTKDEKNLEFREAFIVENVLEQFFNFPYKKTTQKSVSRDKLWANYDEKSLSSSKLPSDWSQRKELAWRRDNRCCNRCGKELSNINESYINFVKDIKDKGSYSLENIIILCIDCNKVLNSTNPKNSIDSLVLKDKLLDLIKTK
ncbi:HNH endonuclease [Arcobacter defluvii]|uniref:HNH domain-containing protein n=1 Tax=Arcobacter defluvii TaxID=873191 RepID=A0AAE7BFN3_9BACT|nr:HNH endonuclease [Arcobacter defluvii]QKF78416.1 hypothetical protein ADFLV_2428 [Arcobacter defluvii]RXI30799.1 HNH endonuclease [Arcobacter defluvii]